MAEVFEAASQRIKSSNKKQTEDNKNDPLFEADERTRKMLIQADHDAALNAEPDSDDEDEGDEGLDSEQTEF